MRKLERAWEYKEKEERRRNLVLRGIRIGERGIREITEEVLKKIGVEAKIEDIKKIDIGKKDKDSLVVIKVGSEEEKSRIMQNKWKLKGSEIWLNDDLTWEERRVRWKVTQVARKEQGEGRKVRIGQGRIWIEGEWWMWDEERGEFRDTRGQGRNVRMEGERSGRETREERSMGGNRKW